LSTALICHPVVTRAALERLDVIECASKAVLFDLEVVAGLKVEPEPVGGREEAGQPQRGVGRDPALAVDDLVDPPPGDTDGDSQPVLGDLQRNEELLEEDLPGVDGRKGCHVCAPF